MRAPPVGIDFLDVLGVLSENWKALVAGAALAGAAAFVCVSALPVYYRSEAYLSANDESVKAMEAWLRSSAVIEQIIKRFPNFGFNSSDSEQKKTRLVNDRINFYAPAGTTRATSPFIVFAIDNHSSSDAQSINKGILDIWLESTKPKSDARAAIEQRLQRTEQQLSLLSSTLDQLRAEAPKLVLPNSMQGEMATPIVNMIDQRAKLAETGQELQRLLAGTSRDVIVIPPTLPEIPLERPVAIIVALSAVAGFFLVLLVKIISSAIFSIGATEKGSRKLARIRAGLRLWPDRSATS